MLRVAAQDLGRLRQITRILTRHGYQHLAKNLDEGTIDPDDEHLRAQVKTAGGPKRFRLLLQDLGPTFIKLGQVLSTRPDIIPSDFARELSHLQDQVEPMPFEEVKARLEAVWGGPVEEHVLDLDERALGVASIAQVHRARLKDGREVVVKLQRPNLVATIRADLDLLYLLARLLDATIEEMVLYRPVEVVRTFETALLDELDFGIEARNAKIIAANFAEDERVVVPTIHDALSTSEVLVMDYVAGVKITEIEGERIEPVLQTVLDIAFRMAFEHGVFHADPHPGNVLVTPDDRVCILDFGLVGHLTGNMQQTLIQLSMAVAMRDADTTTRLIYRLGRPMGRVPLGELRITVEELMNKYLVRSLDQVDATSLINELTDVAIRYRIRVPPDYALLGKAGGTLEGIIRQLAPELDITDTIMPYAQKLLAERYSPQALGKLAVRTAVQVMDGAQELPLLAHQLLSDLEQGRITIQVHNEEMDRMSRVLNDLGTKLFMGMVAMGTVLGTFFILALYPWEVGGWNMWGILGAALSTVLVMLVLSWHILYTRMRKISVKALLRMWSRRRSSP